MSNQAQQRTHFRIVLPAVGLMTLLAGCNGLGTPAAPSPSSLAAPLITPDPATPRLPEVRLVTTPRRLLREGSVFFFVTSHDLSGKGLTHTEVFLDGKPFVDDPKQHNSYGKYFTAQHNGEHTVRVVVTDALGAQSAAEQQFSVEIARP